MIIAVSGITGVGKSYLKRCVAETLGLKNILMVTTRPKRKSDINGRDKWFVSEEEFEKMKNDNELMLEIEFIKNKYGYYTKEIKGRENGITEIYFNEVNKFKKECKDLIAIYIKPIDIEISKEALKRRMIDEKVMQDRIEEMEYQLKCFESDKNLQAQYDYIFINDYTDKSKSDFINFIKEKINK